MMFLFYSITQSEHIAKIKYEIVDVVMTFKKIRFKVFKKKNIAYNIAYLCAIEIEKKTNIIMYKKCMLTKLFIPVPNNV